MSRLMKQIQEIQEQFDNLFEVDGDGLGQPAVDVPPSQNKIKRDRKTKDGKVELVSVEDELFPYEGNKKEQYRQKIIATINDMIQGKATLEDLLQIVRQKKAPLKEAMEVLESIINEKHVFPKKAVEDGNKKYLEADKKNNEATRLARKGFEKLNKKIKELEGKGIDADVDIEPGVTYGNGPKKEYQQALKTADALHNAQREADREETKARNNQRKLRAEGLKGVVMRQFNYVPTKKGDSFNVKKVLDKNEALKEAVEKYVDNDGNTHELEFSANKNKYKFNHKINGKSVVSAVDSEPNANYERKHAVKNYGLKKVEEALSLMEEIINEVSLGKWKQAATSSAPKRKEEADAAKKFVMKSWDEYARNSKKHPEEEGDFYLKAVEDGMVGAKAENRAHHADKVQYVAPDSKHSANKYLKAAHNSKDEEDEGKAIWAKHVADMDPVKSRTKKSRAYEALEEAMKILEDLQSKIQAQPRSKRVDLEAKYAKMKQKEGKDMLQRILDQRKAMTKEERGQEKNNERTERALRKYILRGGDFTENTPSMYEFESLEEAIAILELFDRPDLLDDIDTALGSPVKKTVKKIITPKKEKKGTEKKA